MLRSYKIEIKPTKEQIQKINKTIGTCRFIYNLFIAHNKTLYNNHNQKQDSLDTNTTQESVTKTDNKKFMSANDFSKYLNNEYLPNNSNMIWIKEVSSKSIKKSIVDAETSFKRFFKGLSDFPKFKKKNKFNVKMYFVKNSPTDIIVERHKIKIPTLGYVRLKEFGYIPLGLSVKSGTVSQKAGHYFISVLIDDLDYKTKDINSSNIEIKTEGLGVDLGIKELAICSDGKTYKNINKTSNKIKKLEKYLKRQQRALARKSKPTNKITNDKKNILSKTNKNKSTHTVELTEKQQNKIKKAIEKKNKLKTKVRKNKYKNLIGTNKTSSTKQNKIENRKMNLNIDINHDLSSDLVELEKNYKNRKKNIERIQTGYYKLSNIREEYNKRVVNEIVRTKPKFITIEDLNVSGMMKNRHLSKAIQKQGFYQFRQFLEQKCNKDRIELRMVNRYYPSSKKCSSCGTIKKDLKLKDRIYRCSNVECELHKNPIDRDYNASLNLKNAIEYKILNNKN